MTASIPSSIDFTDRDFSSLRMRLQGLIRSVFTDWTDFNTSNFGNILMELMCHVGDILHFYQDSQAGECFIPIATQRISLIHLGQLIGYTLPTAAAGSGTAKFIVGEINPVSQLVIPRGTRLQTTDPEDPVLFQTIERKTISAGGSYVEVAVEQSERREESIFSTGEPNQEFVLMYYPYLDDSLNSAEWDNSELLYGVTAANGDYTKVDSLLGYSSSDRVFLALVDQLDRCHISFGNGSVGATPQGEIKIGYKVGGGTRGNVETGKLSIMSDSLAFDDGTLASLAVANEAPTAGGADRISVDEARVQAPASLRLLKRCVARDDFETTARSVRGVARALMATSNEYVGIPENTGQLRIVAQGVKLASGRIKPAPPSSTLLTQVYNEIMNNKPPTVTFTFEVISADFLDVSVKTRVYIRRGFSPTIVGAAIYASLEDFFAVQLATGLDNPDIDFGAKLMMQYASWQGTYWSGLARTDVPLPELIWSDVFNVIRDTNGVRKVDEGQSGLLLNQRRQSLTLTPVQFPRLVGNPEIYDADTDSQIFP